MIRLQTNKARLLGAGGREEENARF